MIYHTADNGDYQCVNDWGARATHMVLWQLPSNILPTDRGQIVYGGTQISANTCITATKARLCFQGDGNLVVYDEHWVARWSIGSQGTGRTCFFWGDGHLVVYDANMNAVWGSGTWGNPGAQLYVQNDGNVVIFNHAATVLWSTGTFH